MKKYIQITVYPIIAFFMMLSLPLSAQNSDLYDEFSKTYKYAEDEGPYSEKHIKAYIDFWEENMIQPLGDTLYWMDWSAPHDYLFITHKWSAWDSLAANWLQVSEHTKVLFWPNTGVGLEEVLEKLPNLEELYIYWNDERKEKYWISKEWEKIKNLPTKLPSSLYQKRRLRKLHIYADEFSPELANLNQLEELQITSSRRLFKTFPDQVVHLPALKTLKLYLFTEKIPTNIELDAPILDTFGLVMGNMLKNIPNADIAKWYTQFLQKHKGLKYTFLGNHCVSIDTMPVTLTFPKMKDLQTVKLGGFEANNITVDICKVKNLNYLEPPNYFLNPLNLKIKKNNTVTYLDLTFNLRLEYIPKYIFEMKNLKVLDLRNNTSLKLKEEDRLKLEGIKILTD